MQPPIEMFRAGDILLYSTRSLIDDLIRWKTSGECAHVEVYAGNGQSWASRNTIGVGKTTYPFRPDGLVIVKRPVMPFNYDAASSYFEKNLAGLPYGFDDILANIGIDRNHPKGVDCSHMATLLLENAGCLQFDVSYNAAKISPRDFQISPLSNVIWTASKD